MIFLEMSFVDLFSEIGITSVGSVALFSFIVILLFVIIMALLRVPSVFILFVAVILSSGIASQFGNTGIMRTILAIGGLIIGVIIGFLISGLFYKD